MLKNESKLDYALPLKHLHEFPFGTPWRCACSSKCSFNGEWSRHRFNFCVTGSHLLSLKLLFPNVEWGTCLESSNNTFDKKEGRNQITKWDFWAYCRRSGDGTLISLERKGFGCVQSKGRRPRNRLQPIQLACQIEIPPSYVNRVEEKRSSSWMRGKEQISRACGADAGRRKRKSDRKLRNVDTKPLVRIFPGNSKLKFTVPIASCLDFLPSRL